METYATEEERLEALQRWWKENKQSLFVGLLLGLAILGAWKVWQSHRQSKIQEASVLYHQLIEATQQKQTDASMKLGYRLVQQYPSTPYSQYAQLFVAKTKVESGDLKGAKQTLEDAMRLADDGAMKALVRLRLGRVMLALGEVDNALKLINETSEKSQGKLSGLYEELKGDLYMANNRAEDARKAYEKSKALGENTPLLDLKLNDMPVPQ